MGLTHPETLTSCPSSPGEFLRKFYKFQNTQFSSLDDAMLDLLMFQALTYSDMNCLLTFSNEFIEVARINWQLRNLFMAIELKLSQCQR